MQRVEAARPQRLALRAADRTATLHRSPRPSCPAMRRPRRRGYLDFDDLIARAKALLEDRSVAAWVLFRLDGGIDHILVDEAQDTSPDQWRIIELLTDEFTASGERPPGASGHFSLWATRNGRSIPFRVPMSPPSTQASGLCRGFRAAGQFQSLELEYSFRSAPAVLRLVDATFGDRFPEAVGGQHGTSPSRRPCRAASTSGR